MQVAKKNVTFSKAFFELQEENNSVEKPQIYNLYLFQAKDLARNQVAK